MKVCTIPFANWFYRYFTEGKDIINASFLLERSDDLKFQQTDLYKEEFLFYFTNGYFKQFPKFKILKKTKNEEKVYLTLFHNWNKILFYNELSEFSGFKNGARFIGNCMKKNPLPIIIPCHHIVGKQNPYSFTPTPAIKKYLLELENKKITSIFSHL